MTQPKINGSTITIPSDLKYLTDAVEFVEEKLRGYGADDPIVADIAISVSELVTNSINHGNQKDTSKPVKITVTQKNGSASIAITDQGTGFNPNEIDDPLAEENLLKDTGRGIFIVKALMDEVDIRNEANGTVIVISKKIK